MPNAVFCLMGPTASGKTELALELVQQFPFEIVSVDSAMIYRGMDIGTAKPDCKALVRATHHLIDILDPPERYSASAFCHDVADHCEQIIARGNVPLLVGGTMMYFHAFQHGLSSLPQANEHIRAALLQEGQQYGWAHMHQTLAQVDRLSAARIHPNDKQRIQRALEVYRLTGKPLSAFLNVKAGIPSYRFINLILTPEKRTWLHARIGLRFEQMLAEGFVSEVENLLQKWDLTLKYPSIRCVGYRQVFDYLQGKYDYITLFTKGVEATRQLAKRQLTWLRHWPDAHHLRAENPMALQEMMAIITRFASTSPENGRGDIN